MHKPAAHSRLKMCNLRDVPVPPDDRLEDVGEILVGQAHNAQPAGVLGCLVRQDPPLDLPEVAQAAVPALIAGQLAPDRVWKRGTRQFSRFAGNPNAS